MRNAEPLRAVVLPLRPARFGELAAVRFEMRATNPDGLVYRSSVLAAERDAKLYLLLYIATAEHYYERNLPDVERLFATARLRWLRPTPPCACTCVKHWAFCRGLPCTNPGAADISAAETEARVRCVSGGAP